MSDPIPQEPNSDQPHRLNQPNAAYLDDHGDADPDVRAALDAADRVENGYLKAVAALGGARLLMPIVASGSEARDSDDGLPHAEMAAVSITNDVGEKALLAFTGIDSLKAWNSDGRPVPCTLDELAGTVSEAGSTHLVIDIAGPSTIALIPELVTELAQGRRLIELEDGGFGWMFVEQG